MAALAENIFVLSLIALTLYFVVPPVLKKRKKRALDRLTLIIRKSHAGNVYYLSLQQQDRKRVIEETSTQWTDFHTQLSRMADYHGGIQKFANGIPSNTSESWQAIQVFAVNNYAEFHQCLELLNKPKFSTLNRMLDIQMVYGRPIGKKGQNLRIFN
jgi:hypothetical protein